MTSVTSIDKNKTHSHPTDSAIEENRQKGIRKGQGTKKGKGKGKAGAGFGRVPKHPKPVDHLNPINGVTLGLFENCVAESELYKNIQTCRLCKTRNLQQRYLDMIVQDTRWIMGYRRCLNCGKIQEPSISKLLGLVKGGVR